MKPWKMSDQTVEYVGDTIIQALNNNEQLVTQNGDTKAKEHGRKYDKYQAAMDVYSEDNDKPKLEKTLAAISKFLPWLVMVPGTLVIQWCKEANKLSRLFQLVIYYTDRKKVPVAMDI
ncbi:hypothetical protein BLS_002555 [Venturia inaequalis]|uniref:Uncharacterized protein n=1 Tax=Venturia inaequalis TaxID=5025 RepID=A0A8H3U110_VENIN|nr:hypothetical protein BLS_002555 [Venturia inaequalis]